MVDVEEVPRELVIDYVNEHILSDEHFPVRKASITGMVVEQHGSFVEARSADGRLIFILGGSVLGMDWDDSRENFALQRESYLNKKGYDFVFGSVPVGGATPNYHCSVFQRSGR